MKKTVWVVGLTILFSIIVLIWWSRPINPESEDTSPLAATPTLPTTAKDGQITDVVFDFLSSQYGEYVLKQKGWKARDEKQNSIARIYQICLDQTQINEQQVLRYVAVCASPADGEPLAHVESGLIDLFVWDESKKHAIASKREISSGSYGKVGNINLLQVGPHHFAFVIEDAYTELGYTVVQRQFYSTLDNQLKLIAKINLQRDNEGSIACEAASESPLPDPTDVDVATPPTQEAPAVEDTPVQEVPEKERCHIEKYTLSFNPQSEHHGFYDLNVTLQLQEDETSSERSETMVFDPKNQTYPVPESFQQGW